jgi:hypothetical protein
MCTDAAADQGADLAGDAFWRIALQRHRTISSVLAAVESPLRADASADQESEGARVRRSLLLLTMARRSTALVAHPRSMRREPTALQPRGGNRTPEQRPNLRPTGFGVKDADIRPSVRRQRVRP